MQLRDSPDTKPAAVAPRKTVHAYRRNESKLRRLAPKFADNKSVRKDAGSDLRRGPDERVYWQHQGRLRRGHDQRQRPRVPSQPLQRHGRRAGTTRAQGFGSTDTSVAGTAQARHAVLGPPLASCVRAARLR